MKLPKIKTGKLGRSRWGDPRPGPSQGKDHAKFIAKSCYTTQGLNLLLQELSCKSISIDSKLDIMHQAVALCPEIVMTIKGKPTKSLLDSRSQCRINLHNLFNLKGMGEGHIPLKRHFKCDIEVGGQLVHRVGILVKKDKILLLDSKGRKAKTPALLHSNLIHITLNEFCETFGEECLHLFKCPVCISPLWFSTLCLYYYAHVTKKAEVGASSVKTYDLSNDKDKGNNPNALKAKDSKLQDKGNNQAKPGESSQENKSKQKDQSKSHQKKINTLGRYASRVMVGDKRKPICIPVGMSKVVVGRALDKLPKGSYMVKATDNNNLPCGVSVNHSYINPTKSRQVSVILLNTNTYKVWICQPLYAANIFDVKLKDWEYEPIMTKSEDSNTVEVKLQQVPPEDLREEILSYAAKAEQRKKRN